MTEVIADQTDWGKIRVTGDDRQRFMHGMCTANIEQLAAGDWIRAAMLNLKGRVTAIYEVVNRGDDLLLICQPDLTDKVLAQLDRHAIMDDVAFTVVELPLYRVWSDIEAVWTAAPVFAAPAAPSSADAVEIRRIEAGMPRYGVDVSEDNFPFESLLARHVDYEKGCYIGQEPVYRVHSKGEANKMLRGLRVDGDGQVAVGAAVDHPERAGAGTVTSAAVSPQFGSIALAYLRRKAWNPGDRVTVDGRSAVLVELPFGS